MERICIKYGLLTAAALITLFLGMRMLGLAERLELRFLNAIILIFGIILSIREYRKNKDGRMQYLQGISCGTLTTLCTVSVFAVFMFIYLMFLDPAFMQAVKANHSQGQFLNPYVAAVAVFMEGLFSGIVMTFMTMQVLKESLLDRISAKKPLPGKPGIPVLQ
jgi:hypothetical protein